MKVTFLTALLLLFIALKLMGYITWSWWWVLSPIWLGFAIIFAIALIVSIVVAVRSA